VKRALVLVPFVVGALANCGGAGQVENSDALGDAGTDAATTVQASDPDAGFEEVESGAGVVSHSDGGCVGAADPPDSQGLDTNCDGVDGVVGRDIYVNVDLGQDTNPGTPTFPMATVSAALAIAAKAHGSVLISESSGTYPVDTLAVPGTWGIYGGYPSAFVGAPNRQVTTLTAPPTGLLLQTADGATLAHLTIQGAMPRVASEPTAHALRTSVATLSLLDVALQAGDGLVLQAAGGGAVGEKGVYSLGPLVCRGVTQPSYTNGSCCGEATLAGISPGNYAASVRAAPGAPGAPGSDGADATGTLANLNGVILGDTAQPGNADGLPGYGSAVGGGGRTDDGTAFNGGNGGSGGCPGYGGSGGQSGGSSIALVVLAGKVTVQGSTLQTGFGADGAAGGVGGAGGSGGYGESPTYLGGATPNAQLFPNYECALAAIDQMGHQCAAFGGIGGTGGAGGHGGGGGGGWSVGTLTVGSATVTFDAASGTTLGPAGNGGLGNNGGHAPNGRRVATWHLD
jgi:hypothetical protein